MQFFIAIFDITYNIEINKSFMLNSVFLGAAVLFDLELLHSEISEFSLSLKKRKQTIRHNNRKTFYSF